ncbi:MAG: hypothetical protein DWQ34_26745 [Planctomycetota bacterium]|nr:MAG: hypothetical protein DWQ34_26745 [Planctomycetota bacterium]REK22817.1 MAG: hypothetical protein DWQ41_18650 [Planctomycetota bacterium]REK31582.1 MAG: hypothetical protein DWQ45_19360 [Planctomycetota bacterium]
MGSSEVVLIAFGSVALIALAAALVLRDLFFPQKVAAGSVAANGDRTIRRLPTVFDQAPAKTLTGRIDQGFDRLVLETGYEITPAVGFMLVVCSALLLGGGFWLYSNEPLAGVAGGLLGVIFPLAVMAVRRSRRMNEVREQLPHLLDMLARTTRAGQSIEQAVHLIGEEAEGVLAAEFRRCSQQLEMGRSFEKVFKSLAARLRLVEMRILATTLIVQRQTGGRLSETLERMAAVVRDRLNAHRQIKASTGAGRTSTLVISAIGPIAFLGLFLLHRPHVQYMLDDPTGQLLLWIALLLEIVGLLWVFTLLKKEET